MAELVRKIVILPSWYPCLSSPVNGIFVHQQAIALSGKFQVSVVAPELIGYRRLVRTLLASQRSVEVRDGIPAYQDPAISPLPGRSTMVPYWSYLWSARRRLEKLIEAQGKPDLIHAHVVLPAGWAAAQLGKRFNVPVVLTEHSSPFSVHLRSRVGRQLVRETLNRVDALVTVSPGLLEQIRAFHPQAEAEVVGNVIATTFFEPLPKAEPQELHEETRFLTVGLLTEQKGIPYLLQAARELVERGHRTFSVAIGGNGSIRPALEQLAASLELSERCRFLGLLSPSQVREWMRASDAIVVSSVHETFGIVLGEAMACGKPVIATRCGGPEFVVTPETGILVDVANPAALADAMEGFILRRYRVHPQTIRESVVRRFGEEAFVDNISRVYEKVSARHHV